MKCIRCEETVRMGSLERCPRDPSGGEHEGHPHPFVNGALDGRCNHVDDDGLRCGFREWDWEDGIVGASLHMADA